MIRALWTGATGMHAQQTNMDVIANNLANVNTSGFKRGRADFQDLLYQTLRLAGTTTSAGNEVPTGIQVGHGTRLAAVQNIFLQGDFMQTMNELDLTIEGKGFFQITKRDGEIG
jgi:flagellar basal-body rod protein FlgG